MNQQRLLFEDKDVKITNQFLTIKCYFFPFGNSKRIPLKDIVKIEVRDLGMAKMRLWGMDIAAWGYWLPGDIKRCSREQFIAVYTGKSIVPSFTTEHTAIVYNILASELQKIKQIDQGPPQITDVFIHPNNHVQPQDSMTRPILH